MFIHLWQISPLTRNLGYRPLKWIHFLTIFRTQIAVFRSLRYLVNIYSNILFSFECLKESPEPIDAPGWRKLRSHAHHPEELLMREKALLFKDYIQPYNFASSELKPPETSRESLFGSTNGSSANINSANVHISSSDNMNSSSSANMNSSMSASESSRYLQKRQYHIQQVKQSKIVVKHVHPVSSVPSSLLSGDGSAESSPETIHREPEQYARSPYNNKTYQPGSMEWDPFIDAKNNATSKKASKGISCRRKIVSPISEGDENVSSEKHGTSLEANDGSMFPERTPDISDTSSSYVDSAPSTYNKNESSPQYTFRSTGDDYSLTSGGGGGGEGSSSSASSSSSSSSSSSGGSKTKTESTMTGWNTEMTYDNNHDH